MSGTNMAGLIEDPSGGRDSLADARRRRRVAEALATSAIDTTGIRTNTQGIAKLIQALGGSLGNVLEARNERDIGNEQQAGLDQFNSQLAGGQPTAAPPAPAVAAEAPPVAASAMPPPVAPPQAEAPAPNIYGRNQALVAQRDALLGADPIQLASATQANLPPGQPAFNPARPGANSAMPGWDAGTAPPTGRINPTIGGAPSGGPAVPPAALAAAVTGQGAPAPTPAVPNAQMQAQILMRGLSSPNPQIRAQARAMLPIVQSNIAREDQQTFRREERQSAEQFRRQQLEEARLSRPERQAQTVQTAEGIFVLNPNGTLGGRLGGLPRETAPPIAPPAGYRPTPEGGLEPIPGGPADPATVAATTAARQPEARPLADTAINRLSGLAGISSEWSGLNGTFNDAYAGYGVNAAGNVANAVARNNPMAGPEARSRADWWQRYNLQANQVRNELFGSALTAPEKAAFDAAMIGPGMAPEQIRRNLARQEQIARAGIERQGRAMIANGSSRRTVETLLGGAIPDEAPSVSVPAERNGQSQSAGGGWSIRPVQ